MKIILTGQDFESVEVLSAMLSSHPQLDLADTSFTSIIIGKNGLIDLCRSMESCFHVNRSSKKIREFELLARTLLCHEEIPLLDSFLDDITAVDYEGMPFCDRSELSPLKTILFEKMRRKAKNNKRKPRMGSMYIPTDKLSFRKRTKGFLEQLMSYRFANSQNLLMVMPETYPAISENSSLLTDSMIVFLNHDPRNLFALNKQRQDPWLRSDPVHFCKWHISSMRILSKEVENLPTLLFVQYENLIDHPNEVLNSICRKLEIEYNVLDMGKSGLNRAGSSDFYKTACSNDEVKIINRECTELILQAQNAINYGV